MALIQKPDALTLAGNIKDIIVTSTAAVRFVLVCKGNELVNEEYSPIANKVVIQIREVVDELLRLEIPNFNNATYEQVNASSEFSATLTGTGLNEVFSFTCIKGGVAGVIDSASFLQTNFLTWQPQQKKIILRQPEWLTYYVSAPTNFIVKAYFTDGTSELYEIGIPAGKVVSVNTGYDTVNNYFDKQVSYYDVWTEIPHGERLSYIQRYLPTPESDCSEIYVFENTLGGIDSFVCCGELKEKISTEGVLSTQFDLTEDSTIDLSIIYEQNTGFLNNRDEAKWLHDFFVSRNRYHVADGLRRIYIESQENEFVVFGINSFAFEFYYCNQTLYNNVVRNRESIPELLEFPTPDGLFFLTPRLNEYPLATKLDDLILPVQSCFEQAWKRISISQLIAFFGGGGGGGDVDLSDYWNKKELYFAEFYLTILGEKIKAGFADSAELWGDAEFKDYLNQAVRTTDDVTFNNLILSAMLRAKDIISESFTTPSFTSGMLGSGTRLKDDHLELDRITVRKQMIVRELLIEKVKSIGGTLILSTGAMKITAVENGGAYFKCTFDNDGGNINNPFIVDDQVLHQTFTGKDIKRYWRRVTSIGADYFNLSQADCEAGSADPLVGDEVVQLGHRTDTSRQSASILCAVGADAPYYDNYAGINSFSLGGKLITREGNLAGIVDEVFGQLSGTGLYANNVYLRGQLALQSGEKVSDSLSGLGDELSAVEAKTNTAQNTADAVQRQITSVAREVQVVANAQDGFNVKVESVENKMDNLQTGTRNLVTDRQNIITSGADFPAETTCTSVLNDKGERETTVTTIAAKNDHTAYRYNFIERCLSEKIYAGQYVFSFDYNTNHDDGEVFVDWRFPVLVYRKTLENTNGEWKRGYFLCDWTNQTTQTSAILFIRVRNNAIGNYVAYRNIKLVRGNKGWDDSPAPEDVQAQSEAIAQKRLDELQIGGVNLCDNFKNWFTVGVTADISEDGNSVMLTLTDINEDGALVAAKNLGIKGNYICSVNVETSGETKMYIDPRGVIFKSSHEQYRDNVYFTLPAGFKERIVVYTNSDTVVEKSNYVGIAGDSRTKSCKFAYVQLEIGNKATAWSPSLADQQADSERIAQLKAEAERVKAEAYADGIVTAEEQRAIADTQAKYNSAVREAERKALGASWSSGKMLNQDPTFKLGLNGIVAYNNTGNGNVILNRISKLPDSPVFSDFNIEIKNIGSSSPGLGGFTFQSDSRANAVFICRLIAKIPIGYTVEFATNIIGNGGIEGSFWATQKAGTGKWEEYIYVVKCGATGSFSTTNFYYLDGALGTPSSPVVWYLAYASVFDVTDGSNIQTEFNVVKTELTAQITALDGKINLCATKAEYNSLGQRLTTAESQINATAGSIELMVKKTDILNTQGTSIKLKPELIEISGATVFRDDNGNVVNIFGKGTDVFSINNGVFRVSTYGMIYSLGAEMENVKIKSGTIAGFNISGSSLTNEGFSNDASLIFRNDGEKVFAGIGCNVLPPSLGGHTALCRLENNRVNPNLENYGLMLNVSGGVKNIAIDISSGLLVADGGAKIKPRMLERTLSNVVHTVQNPNDWDVISLYPESGTTELTIAAAENGKILYIVNRNDNKALTLRNTLLRSDSFSIGGGAASAIIYITGALGGGTTRGRGWFLLADQNNDW